MGGADCPPCKEYELFLKKNHEVLKKSFANVVIGDIQTWVRGPNIHFVVDGKKITIEEFRIRVGDTNKRNVTPTIWLLDKNLQQIRQLPQFTAQFFLSIERHKELLE